MAEKLSLGYELFVPESHVNCTLTFFDWEKKEALREMVSGIVDGKRQKGMALIGDPGVGKTHLMVGMFKEMLSRGAMLGKDVLFLSWSEFIQDLFDSMAVGVSPESILERVTVGVLLIDDIRPMGGKMWQDILRKLIEKLYDTEGLAVLSTNANSIEDLVKAWQLEDYWLSRLLARFEIVLVRGKDRRIG